MDHWRSDFVNRPLPRPVYLAVRWTDLVELWVALRVRRELSCLRLLLEIDVDFERLDEDQERLHRMLLIEQPRVQSQAISPPLGSPVQGVWV